MNDSIAKSILVLNMEIVINIVTNYVYLMNPIIIILKSADEINLFEI